MRRVVDVSRWPSRADTIVIASPASRSSDARRWRRTCRRASTPNSRQAAQAWADAVGRDGLLGLGDRARATGLRSSQPQRTAAEIVGKAGSASTQNAEHDGVLGLGESGPQRGVEPQDRRRLPARRFRPEPVQVVDDLGRDPGPAATRGTRLGAGAPAGGNRRGSTGTADVLDVLQPGRQQLGHRALPRLDHAAVHLGDHAGQRALRLALGPPERRGPVALLAGEWVGALEDPQPPVPRALLAHRAFHRGLPKGHLHRTKLTLPARWDT